MHRLLMIFRGWLLICPRKWTPAPRYARSALRHARAQGTIESPPVTMRIRLNRVILLSSFRVFPGVLRASKLFSDGALARQPSEERMGRPPQNPCSEGGGQRDQRTAKYHFIEDGGHKCPSRRQAQYFACSQDAASDEGGKHRVRDRELWDRKHHESSDYPLYDHTSQRHR